MLTVEELERLKAAAVGHDAAMTVADWTRHGRRIRAALLSNLLNATCRTESDAAGLIWMRNNLSTLAEAFDLAIHGLNCQAAGITEERLKEGVSHWPAELKAPDASLRYYGYQQRSAGVVPKPGHRSVGKTLDEHYAEMANPTDPADIQMVPVGMDEVRG